MLAVIGAACGSDDDDAAVSFDGAEETAATVEPDVVGGAVDDDAGFDLEAADEGEAMAEEEAAAVDAPSDATPAAQGTDPDAQLGTGAATVAQSAADLGRKLIFTAQLQIEVDDVAAASAEATEIVQSMGGFLFGQNTIGGDEAISELTFKVLPDDFNRTLEALGSVGELRNQSVTTDDVTERIVDLESRIQVAELGVERLRAALEGSETLEDYAEIERLLLDRESNLEVMRGQLRTLQDRVDLATITLILTQDRLANNITLDISAYEDHDDGQSCPGQGGGSYEADAPVTVCFDIVNRGDQTLTNITLTDTVLEIDDSTELITVFGSLDELAPGQAVLVAFEARPERDLTLRTRVTAIPTDGTSTDPAGPSVSTRGEFGINTFEPDRDPGFGDGFGAAVDIIQGLWVVLKVLVGFLILPLLILVPLFVVLRRLVGPRWRRRQADRQALRGPGPMGGYDPRVPPPPSGGQEAVAT
ncbi:MAG: DUF4349 domain-containing protein, partial [Actinomycetota bacterium]